MKLFKLRVTGNNTEFAIKYEAASDFITYINCGYAGSEQEKYSSFLEDLQKNGGPQPVNVKVQMTTQTTDRAFAKNDVLKIKEVSGFIDKLSK